MSKVLTLELFLYIFVQVTKLVLCITKVSICAGVNKFSTFGACHFIIRDNCSMR